MAHLFSLFYVIREFDRFSAEDKPDNEAFKYEILLRA